MSMKMSFAEREGLKKYFITDKLFYKRALFLILPMVMQNCINQGVNMMDTIMVGNLGEIAISASSLANQFYMVYRYLCMGMSAAGMVLASQYWGARDKKTVCRVFDLILQLVILGGLIFMILTLLMPGQIMRIYTPEEDVIQAGIDYLRATAFIFLPHGISLVMSNLLRAVGDAKMGMYVSLLSFGVNIVCNYIFIFGKLGCPAMGLTGAALGTLCARIVELGVCAVYMLKFEKGLNYRPWNILKVPTQKMLKEFARLGLPAVISDTMLSLADSAVSMILGHMGKEIVSAYSIVTVMSRMCTTSVAGIASAAGVVVGQTVGEGDTKRAMKEGYSFLAIGSAMGLAGSILVQIIGRWSISLYDITPHTAAITLAMMNAVAIVTFFDATQSTFSKGVLRGGGDTRFLMIADVFFQWCVSVPVGYLAGFILVVPPFWVLIAVRLDFILKSIWMFFRMRSGKWIHKARSMRNTKLED